MTKSNPHTSNAAFQNLQEKPCNIIAFTTKTKPWRPPMSRKRAIKAAKHSTTFELSQALVNNCKAWEEGPKRKSWSRHDLRTIRPQTAAQEDMFHAYINNYNICGYGVAGSGKSFLALYLALTDLFDEKTDIDRVIIVRSIVSTRDPGHLPGTLEEKVAPHESTYHDILYELIGKTSTYQDMKDAGLIEFHSSSFVRGITWNNAIIIIDEAQNMTLHEFNSVITRLGKNTKLIVLGDIQQNDLIYSKKETSGFVDVLRVLEYMNKEIAMIQFTIHDIVRGAFVKSWICAREELGI